MQFRCGVVKIALRGAVQNAVQGAIEDAAVMGAAKDAVPAPHSLLWGCGGDECSKECGAVNDAVQSRSLCRVQLRMRYVVRLMMQCRVYGIVKHALQAAF